MINRKCAEFQFDDKRKSSESLIKEVSTSNIIISTHMTTKITLSLVSRDDIIKLCIGLAILLLFHLHLISTSEILSADLIRRYDLK